MLGLAEMFARPTPRRIVRGKVGPKDCSGGRILCGRFFPAGNIPILSPAQVLFYGKVEDLLRASVEFLGSPTFSPTKDPGNGRFVVPVDQKKYWSGELLFYLDKKWKSSFWRQKI